MPGWVQHIRKDGTTEWIPKGEHSRPEPAAAAVLGDIPDYQSPVTGEPISGRKQRREDLKRHGCVEYEPSLKGKRETVLQEQEAKLLDSMVERMRWHGA